MIWQDVSEYLEIQKYFCPWKLQIATYREFHKFLSRTATEQLLLLNTSACNPHPKPHLQTAGCQEESQTLSGV